MWKKIATLAAIALLTAGCTGDSLEKLHQATPAGTPFEKALAKHYEDFATETQKNYNWSASAHFAEKGLQAAQGNDVAPEDPKDWGLPKAVLSDMNIAHDKLIAVLSPAVKKAAPERAADAQFYYDCWLEHQANNTDVATCRDGFYAALDKLHGNAPMAQELSPIDRPDYMVFFEWDKANLTAADDTIMDQLIAALVKNKNDDSEITLGGHTDTTGSVRYNLKLSRIRAETVRDRLVAGGISEARIKIFAYGKSDPLIQTGDQVREPRNRRVEIFLGK